MPVYSLSTTVVYILVWTTFELLMWLAILVTSERPFPFLNTFQNRIESTLARVFRRPAAAVAGIFLLVFVGRLLLIPIAPIPPPKIVDDFSQLLAADTFAHGRVTNPTHPMWFYFETFMVNQKPTYHSMYPPATGLVLAVAQVLTGLGTPSLGALGRSGLRPARRQTEPTCDIFRRRPRRAGRRARTWRNPTHRKKTQFWR